MMVKMAAAFIVSALLTCCCLVSCTDPVCDHYARKGGDFIVPLGFKLDAIQRLTWTHEGTAIFKQRGESIHPGKKEDISVDGSLKLRNVRKENEGMYSAAAHNKDGKSVGTFGPVRLCVQDSVKQPKVTVTCHKKTQEVKFTCSDKGEDEKVEWSQNGRVIKETGLSVTFNAVKVLEDKFTCKVSNKVSTNTSVAVIQTCYSSTLPTEIFGINTWVVIGAGGGIALLLLIIVIVCCIQARRRKRMHIKDEEELRLDWTNPNQQQQQHHHHHHHPPNQRHHHHHHQEHQQHQHQHQHRQQPAGHTGPRPHRPKQQRQKKQPDQYSSQPQPSPRRPAQARQPADEEKPPPLPQPRKKAPKTPKM